MNAELEAYKKLMLKKARQTAVVFAVLSVFAMISLVYAFIQEGRAAAIAADCNRESVIFRERAEKAEETLKATSLQLEQAIVNLEIAKAVAEDLKLKSKR